MRECYEVCTWLSVASTSFSLGWRWSGTYEATLQLFCEHDASWCAMFTTCIHLIEMTPPWMSWTPPPPPPSPGHNALQFKAQRVSLSCCFGVTSCDFIRFSTCLCFGSSLVPGLFCVSPYSVSLFISYRSPKQPCITYIYFFPFSFPCDLD